MGLSLQSNWVTTENPILDMSTFNDHPSEVAEALEGFSVDSIDPSLLLIDSLFDQPNEPVYTEPISFNDPTHSETIVSLTSDFHHPSDDMDFYRCRKRPRSCGHLYQLPDFMFEANSFFNGAPNTIPVMNNSHSSLSELTTDLVVPSPVAVRFSEFNSEKKPGGDGCLSAQSVAARERRKRISEKTQELGRLIPGGNKMNTAEMFQSAYKYVKFLQAQVGILGLLDSNKEYKVSTLADEQMQVLLASPTIQEKLYGEGRCIVPKLTVETLVKDREIKSNILISRELDGFMESMG